MAEPSPSSSSSSNRTLDRVALILDALDVSSCSASELARRTGLSVSTVHRLALSMTEHGFLRRDSDGLFRMGQRFVRSALEAAALPVLRELQRKTGETAQLWVRRGNHRLCLATVDSAHELRAALPLGARLELPAGSAGRILARDASAWAEIAERGWSDAESDRTPGLGSVSAPVIVGEQLVGAVCLALPLVRVTVSPGDDFGAAVVAAARDIASAAHH